ncbi:MAG: cyclic nucleotide-binding domain-containing protein [Myxococcales bacterium]|nr:cyclic nucleotide-binding domain-containing protein [Myxococcales bacterium]
MSASRGAVTTPWPRQVFESPVLRGLDGRGREALVEAGRLRDFAAGDVIYRAGDPGDAFFVVAHGEVELFGARRGDAEASRLRLVRRSETFGEEAVLPGSSRRAEARALSDIQVAEVPARVLTRAATREGAENYGREERALRRQATRDLLSTLAFTRELDPHDVDLVLDAAEYRSVRRGERLYVTGDPADDFYLLVDGLVQLQTETDAGIRVTGYLSRGDFFGDEEVQSGQPRRLTAAALGECAVLCLPISVLRTLADRNPGLLPRLRRISAERQRAQVKLVGDAAKRTTQHVFKDVYRMQMARALLAIDQDTCVRCGHCAWACEHTHGVSRLVRRGDKIITPLVSDSSAPKSLLLPNSCQHCKNPVCMIDCPTGAIGREAEGEVFIREDLCTGCTACAKACPWDNIRMAPRMAGGGLAARLKAEADSAQSGKRRLDLVQIYPEVAVKCDLCRDFSEPACVVACPTESIFRLDPSEEIQEVRALFGGAAQSRKLRAARPWQDYVFPLGLGGSLVLGAVLLRILGEPTASRSLGLGMAVAALGALGCFGLAAYVLPKRRLKLWMKAAQRSSLRQETAHVHRGRSRVKPYYVAHVLGGLLVLALVAGHTRLGLGHGLTAWLSLTFWAVAALGLLGAWLQHWLPARLARIERAGLLPEDFPAEKRKLNDRLFREISGRSDLVKKIAERVLLPYARSPVGPLWLFLSGRSAGEEQARLESRIDEILQGRGAERRLGLDQLTKIAVELRALPLRRVLTFSLRAWHTPHAMLSVLLLIFLLLHVVSVVGAS